MSSEKTESNSGSQTLVRGLRALMLIGEAEQSLTVPALAKALGIHRSMAYRLVTALEGQGFVDRSSAGHLELGTALYVLARKVAKNLQSIAERELLIAANELNMTAFLTILDVDMVVTLTSVVPQSSDTTVVHRPGSRHSIDRGAPGRVIRSIVDPAKYPPKRYEFSTNEVLPGLSSIAVPLVISPGKPAAIAVVFPQVDVDREYIANVLESTAKRIGFSI